MSSKDEYKMTQVIPHPIQKNEITQAILNSLNVEQAKDENLENLLALGGIEGLADKLGINTDKGLSPEQAEEMQNIFGRNVFPSAPQKWFIVLFYEALQDPVLLVLIAAATISLIVETIQHPTNGWIDAVAIFIAIFLVAIITSANDYSKELQFRALEKTSQQDEFSTVIRNGETQRVRAHDIVVGDICVFQAGDMIPADCIITDFSKALCNEASLTGEPEDRKKSKDHDPFLLSSTLLSETDGDVHAMVTGIGMNSQWGKIKANLITEDVNTPLQDKLERMTHMIGYVGMGFAFATFIALVAQIFVQHQPIGTGFINAFILAVVIVVVAIPEGLPLAVAIALAYSTKKMYSEKCFIRILAACETMGNATNICSDKTGTLTENRMTVVTGWFADQIVHESDFNNFYHNLSPAAKQLIVENSAVNRTAYYVLLKPFDLKKSQVFDYGLNKSLSDSAQYQIDPDDRDKYSDTKTGDASDAVVYQLDDPLDNMESKRDFPTLYAGEDNSLINSEGDSIPRTPALVTPMHKNNESNNNSMSGSTFDDESNKIDENYGDESSTTKSRTQSQIRQPLPNKKSLDLSVDSAKYDDAIRQQKIVSNENSSSENKEGPPLPVFKSPASHGVTFNVAPQSAKPKTQYVPHADLEPKIIGNKTEASLMTMIRKWGQDPDYIKGVLFNQKKDKIFPFDSKKKRSTTLIHLTDGRIRLLCKGAAEWVLKDCTQYLDPSGTAYKMNEHKRKEMEKIIDDMANQALRTLALSHLDFPSASALPSDWETNPPDSANLCLDCIVGIIDPIRGDVQEAVSTAQKAGVVVRMVTGDNIATARAIAKQCGILNETTGEICLEGPQFRNLTPYELDEKLKGLRVLARSSPDDKRLLVSRLNGHTIPENEEEWKEMHKANPNAKWDNDKDRLLPGYREEWSKVRPHGGEVVGVTGDGTNDAPALKAADVGLSMGITGTKVAQEASDIVILDDRFSSIINAIKWGRGVYDNIRKFLQFQLTVNVAALILVFVGAVSGYGEPLNPIQMLWVNLVMDTLGALALATEVPGKEVLDRKPYKRSALIVSRPMYRNILVMAIFQLILTFVIMFSGPALFGVPKNGTCKTWSGITSNSDSWDVTTNQITSNTASPIVTCQTFKSNCPDLDYDCYTSVQTLTYAGSPITYKFSNLKDYELDCFEECSQKNYVHGTLIFNSFIFCQLFNEYVARTVDDWNFMKGIEKSPMFLMVSIVSVGLQVLIVELGGNFVKTAPLTGNQWGITIGLGAITVPLGIIMKLFPVAEDPNSFFDSDLEHLK